MTERTLCIVKPDAVRRRVLGRILSMIEEGGLTPVATRLLTLGGADAERFYAVHRQRPFFADLVRFMSSGPVFVAVLEGDGAIARWRDLMGPTDSKKAPK
ncbi:MAG: nucleoside-diphosphate kinase, partial [Deltaproteobacteria bacterium]